MRLEELKCGDILNWVDTDICGMTGKQQAFLDLAPEILAVLEAAIQSENDSQTEELGHLIQLPQELINAIEAFNAALEKL